MSVSWVSGWESFGLCFILYFFNLVAGIMLVFLSYKGLLKCEAKSNRFHVLHIPAFTIPCFTDSGFYNFVFYKFRLLQFRVLQIPAFTIPCFTDSGFYNSVFYRFRLLQFRVLQIPAFTIPCFTDSDWLLQFRVFIFLIPFLIPFLDTSFRGVSL